MREKKNHLYVDSQERSILLHSLVELKNQLIQQGRYTDCVGCFPSSSIAWRCRGEISSVSANFSRVIFWASRKVLMSSPIGVKSNPYLFFLFFSISICPPPVLKFVMFHFTEIEVLIKRDRISIYRNYKCYIGEQAALDY